MMKTIFCMVSIVCTQFVVAYQDFSLLQIGSKYPLFDTQLIMTVNFIAKQSHDTKLDKMLHDSLHDDRLQNFSMVCHILERSLKHLAPLALSCPYNDLQDFLYQVTGDHIVTDSKLMSIQRELRLDVKNMIAQLDSIPDAISLQVMLQKLYHALHEIKKQVITLDKLSENQAWYIYVIFLFLKVTLVEAINSIQSSMNEKVAQQMIISQTLVIVEKIKNIMRSNFIIARGHDENYTE